MTIDEPTRHELYIWFADHMPAKLAEAMMQSIPPTGWGDVATRNDLTANAILLRGEIAEVRGSDLGPEIYFAVATASWRPDVITGERTQPHLRACDDSCRRSHHSVAGVRPRCLTSPAGG